MPGTEHQSYKAHVPHILQEKKFLIPQQLISTLIFIEKAYLKKIKLLQV